MRRADRTDFAFNLGTAGIIAHPSGEIESHFQPDLPVGPVWR